MKYIKKVAKAIGLKIAYNLLRNLVLKWRGFNLLSLSETIAFMAPYEVKVISGERALLPQIKNCGGNGNVIFTKKESITDQVYVWEYPDPKQNARLSKYGSLIIRRKVLCTDWNNSSFYKDIWKADQRPIKSVPAMVALFSQFQDGIFYGGYYDFVFLVAAKFCRIKDAFPNEGFSDTAISYPLFNAPYETDYFQLLGIDPVNLVDSRAYKVVAPRVIAANSAHWYPNKEDVLSLKRHINSKFHPVKTASNRVYISRSGRRCITNEDELIIMLKKFDFIVIEDKPRTVSEQIAIYNNASFILGPHGASFSNIIWCEPGTYLLELFSSNYAPDFFLYLAAIMEMKYAAYYEGAADNKVDYLEGLVEDISVSIPKLEACLNDIFSNIDPNA